MADLAAPFVLKRRDEKMRNNCGAVNQTFPRDDFNLEQNELTADAVAKKSAVRLYFLSQMTSGTQSMTPEALWALMEQVVLHHKRFTTTMPVTLSPQIVRLRPAPQSHARNQLLSASNPDHFINWQQDRMEISGATGLSQ
jgi:hypothetical protein